MRTVQTVCRSQADQDWFVSWFKSIHYQKLYSHRDEVEAARFVDQLVGRLQPGHGATVLDLGCGTGRHARQLAACGCRVLGIDLSAESIETAKKTEGPNLWFRRQDMRLPFGNGVFDYVFNLFTSFGYFADPGDHLTVIHNVAQSLKPEGRFVLDYLNVTHAETHLVREETTERDDVVYRIRRCADENHIFKEIVVEDPGARRLKYIERVARLTAAEFRFMFELCDMTVEEIYGDYRLSRFDLEASPRLIMVARKTARSAGDESPAGQVLADAADGFGRHAQIRGQHHLRHAQRNRRIDPQELEIALLG